MVAHRYAEGVEGGDPQGQEASALLAAAQHWLERGQLSRARAGFASAARAAEASGESEVLVAAAIGVGGLWVQEQRDVLGRVEVRALWERALGAVRPGSIQEALLRVRLSAEATYEGAPVDEVEAGVDAVKAFGDDRSAAGAMSLLHHTQLGPRYAGSRLALAEGMIRRAAAAGDDLMCLMGLCWRTVDLYLLGRPEAGQSLAELRKRAASEPCEAISFIADVLSAMVLARNGQLDKAERAAAAAFERGVTLGDPDAPAYYGAMLAALRWWQGRSGEVLDLVRVTSVSPELGFNDHVYVAADGLLSASVGDVDSAEEALARVTGLGLDRLPHSSSWLTTQFLVAETAFVMGDETVAAAAARQVAPYARLPVMPSLAVVCFGSAERSLGLAAATCGDLDAAVRHLERAIAADQRVGSRPMAVMTEHALAGVLRARRGPDDEAAARAFEARSAERAARIGMTLPPTPDWLRPSGHRSRPRGATRQATFNPSRKGWTLAVEGRSTLLPERVGLVYLTELVDQPGKDVDVLDLASGGIARPERSQFVVDPEAVARYRRRAAHLAATLEGGRLPPAEADKHRQELASVSSALRAATGLGGRLRSFPNDSERARTSVRKALMRAIDDIAAVEPGLGQHLKVAVTTGASCRYDPGDGWTVTVSQAVQHTSEPS